jgi:hypothetical protein
MKRIQLVRMEAEPMLEIIVPFVYDPFSNRLEIEEYFMGALCEVLGQYFTVKAWYGDPKTNTAFLPVVGDEYEIQVLDQSFKVYKKGDAPRIEILEL